MSTNIKKTISLFTAALFVLFAFVVPVSAAECVHQWSDELYTVVEPTCTATGAKAKKCTLCGAYDTANQEIIPLAEHNWIRIGYKAASCSEQGYKKFRCSECTAEKTETLDFLPHNLGEWVVSKEPTCIAEGEEKAVCLTCGAPKTRVLAKVDHVLVTIDAIEPTCTVSGKTEGQRCKVCGTYVVRPVPIDPLGHDFGEPIVDEEREATCTEKGVAHCFCSRCDETLRVEIPKIPHVDEDGDGICDVCENKVCSCHCHYDTFAALLTRYFDTFLNKLAKTDKYKCCDDMEPVEGTLIANIFAYIQRSIEAKKTELSEKLETLTETETTEG